MCFKRLEYFFSLSGQSERYFLSPWLINQAGSFVLIEALKSTVITPDPTPAYQPMKRKKGKRYLTLDYSFLIMNEMTPDKKKDFYKLFQSQINRKG